MYNRHVLDNMDARTTLTEQALAAARGLGLRARTVQREPALGRARADALIEVQYGTQPVLYAAVERRHVTPATVGALVQELRALGDQALLVADYVAPPMADKLREFKIAFLDTAGNAYLDRPPLLVWVKGQKGARAADPAPTGRAFQPGGLQLVFALLCDPKLIDAPFREMAKRAGVAHGTVGWVMADLQQLGYVAVTGAGRRQRRVFEPERLLRPWAEAYARTLRPRTLIGRYYAATIQEWRTWDVRVHDALWGGEPAGALLTDHLRPGELTIYADRLPAAIAARHALVKVPQHGQTAVVDFRRRFWHFDGAQAHPDCTPAVIVYADLLATGDTRCMETAQLVHDDHIARLFEQA
jgi:hypothetical protein